MPQDIEFIMNDDDGELARYNYHYDGTDELNALLKEDLHRFLTIEQMAECVLNEISADLVDGTDDLQTLKDLQAYELISLHHTTGQDIRNAFGLWIEHHPHIVNDADTTSMKVLELMWKKMQNGWSNTGVPVGSQVMTF